MMPSRSVQSVCVHRLRHLRSASRSPPIVSPISVQPLVQPLHPASPSIISPSPSNVSGPFMDSDALIRHFLCEENALFLAIDEVIADEGDDFYFNLINEAEDNNVDPEEDPHLQLTVNEFNPLATWFKGRRKAMNASTSSRRTVASNFGERKGKVSCWVFVSQGAPTSQKSPSSPDDQEGSEDSSSTRLLHLGRLRSRKRKNPRSSSFEAEGKGETKKSMSYGVGATADIFPSCKEVRPEEEFLWLDLLAFKSALSVMVGQGSWAAEMRWAARALWATPHGPRW
ncbi:hypothetical protein Taro_043829 [Colocasia esculenta]|uniref:Uncharacterized protein n=1 Tax=Colocasia esculenta TaxID=4460 RepID=A0A843WM28_COLES|nr:hypothetical protein [Colocasia esculenta]